MNCIRHGNEYLMGRYGAFLKLSMSLDGMGLLEALPMRLLKMILVSLWGLGFLGQVASSTPSSEFLVPEQSQGGGRRGWCKANSS